MAKIQITGYEYPNFTLNGFIDFKTYTDEKCHNQSTFLETCYTELVAVKDPKYFSIELDAFQGIGSV